MSKPFTSTYLDVPGGAWRLVPADTAGAGRRGQMIFGGPDDVAGCVDLESEQVLWQAPLGGFPFALAAGDVNGDGRDEVFAACADGTLYALDADGRPMWSFRTGFPLYNVSVGRIRPGAGLEIVCGGVDGRVTLLTPDGRKAASWPVEALVHRLAAADLDGDGLDEVIAVDRHYAVSVLDGEADGFSLRWSREMRVPPGMLNWENFLGYFFIMSLAVGDLKGDGRQRMVMGDSFWNRQAVMAADCDGRFLWITPPQEIGFRPGRTCREFYSEAIVRIGPARAGNGAKEILVVTGGDVKILNAQGKLLADVPARIGFTDAVFGDDGNVYLGSSPNGDRTIYRLPWNGEFPERVKSLRRHGVPAQIGRTIESVRQAVFRHAPVPESGPSRPWLRTQYPWMENHPGQFRRRADWLREQWPYDQVEYVSGITVREPEPPLDGNGNPWNPYRWTIDSFKPSSTVEEITALCREIQEERIPTIAGIGHSCMPFVTLQTAEKMLQAAPDYLVGFQTSEDEELANTPRYFQEWFGPLMDLCRQYGGRRCMTSSKGSWWAVSPSIEGMFEALFENRRGQVLCGVTENSNSRLPELNTLGMFSLRLAGHLPRFQVSLIGDLFCPNRHFEWEYPRHGHPYLRLLLSQTSLGATDYQVRIRFLGEDEHGLFFTETGRESIDLFMHMLGRGLAFTPEPWQMTGTCPLGFAVHEPPRNWLIDAHNGHHTEKWPGDPALYDAVIPFNGCTWGMAPTPPHALQRIAFNKTRQFCGNVPATPYGPVVFLPARSDRTRVPFVREWWHTDGIDIWREDGTERMRGDAAGRALRDAFEAAAVHLPFRATGDDVFLQTLQMDREGTVCRLLLIDPGWLDPKDRRITVRVQSGTRWQITDLLPHAGTAGKDSLSPCLPVDRDGAFECFIPAGTFRLLEARAL